MEVPSPTGLAQTPVPSFAVEIRSMLHAFGDCERPSADTAAVVEAVVREQMTEILSMAWAASGRRGASHVSLEDVLFLMRRNPIKVQRLLCNLATVDQARSLGQVSADAASNENRRLARCCEFLAKIDTNGKLIKATMDELPDPARKERLRRWDRMAKSMDERKYLEFVKARQVGFAGAKMKNPKKFHDWLVKYSPGGPADAPKLDNGALEILANLAYETVGQIVELSLIVKGENEAASLPEGLDPVHRLSLATQSVNPSFPFVQVGLSGSATVARGQQTPVTPGTPQQLPPPATPEAAPMADSPLRKRLQSGEPQPPVTPIKQPPVAVAAVQRPAIVNQRPLKPDHVREALRRLSHETRAAVSIGQRLDGWHQTCEVRPPLLAL